MANIGSVLKDEIRRLARKEVKSHIVQARRTTARYRTDIANLKRTVRVQQKKLASLELLQAKQPSPAAAADDVAQGSRFSARSVRAQRKRLKLTAAEYASLLGVSAQTIYLWERGQVRPKASQFGALVAARSLGRREARARLGAIGQETAKKARSRRKKRG